MNQSQSGLGQGFGFGIGIIGAIIFLVVVIIGCCCLVFGLAIAFVTISDSGTGSLPRESGGFDAFTTPSEQAQESTGGAGSSFGMGQDVVVGDVRWKVLEAQELGNTLQSDNQLIDPLTTSGRFIRVRFELENRSAEARIFSDVNLVDAQSRTFEDKTEALIGFVSDQERCIFEQLNPNLPRVCATIFEVPLDATGLKVQVGDLDIFGSKEAFIELNLTNAPAPAQPQAPAGAEPPAQPAAGQEPAPPQETAKPAQVGAVGLGQDVFVGQSRWRLLDAQDLGNILQNDSEDLVPLEAAGRLIRVRFEVENTGSETVTFSDVALLDNQRRRFEPLADAIWFIDEPEQCLASELAPGASQVCVKIYDVPTDAAALKLEAFDLISFEAGKALLDLGF